MQQIDSMLLSIEDYTLNANQVKELVLERLLKDGVVNEQTALDYAEKWQIVIIKPIWFKRWCEKFGIAKKDSYQFKFVKLED